MQSKTTTMKDSNHNLKNPYKKSNEYSIFYFEYVTDLLGFLSKFSFTFSYICMCLV